jgi:hypothetical protein
MTVVFFKGFIKPRSLVRSVCNGLFQQPKGSVNLMMTDDGAPLDHYIT